LASNVFALKGTDNGYAWIKATDAEKDALVRDAVRRIKAPYPPSEMRACLDAFYTSSATAYMLEQDLASIMTLCHVQLK
jgi:hypothetical protein